MGWRTRRKERQRVTHGQPGVVDYVSFLIHERYRHLKSALLLFFTPAQSLQQVSLPRPLSPCNKEWT
jgi:hypothetical protein